MLKPRSLLLTLTLLAAVCGTSSPSFAQSTETTGCDPVILECEAIATEYEQLLDDVAAQRDKAIRDTDAAETERDVEAGRRQAVEGELRTLQAKQKPRQPVLLWMGVGAGIVIIVELAAGVLVLAL